MSVRVLREVAVEEPSQQEHGPQPHSHSRFLFSSAQPSQQAEPASYKPAPASYAVSASVGEKVVVRLAEERDFVLPSFAVAAVEAAVEAAVLLGRLRRP